MPTTTNTLPMFEASLAMQQLLSTYRLASIYQLHTIYTSIVKPSSLQNLLLASNGSQWYQKKTGYKLVLSVQS